MTVSANCPSAQGRESPEHCFILVTKSSDGGAPYRMCSKCGIREMVPGDIITAEYVAEILVKNISRMFGISYGQLAASLPLSERWSGGGIVTPRQPKPLREGVVGYSFDGRPIYDGEWFDRQMASLGPSITLHVTLP